MALPSGLRPTSVSSRFGGGCALNIVAEDNAALGASRLRVVLPFFSEALLLSLGGAVVASVIAFLGVRWFDGAVATSR